MRLFDRKIEAVLFDFDGTLADTAADLGNAMNVVLKRRGHQALPLAQLRPHTSQGARGMIRASLGYGVDHPEYAVLKEEFLSAYEAKLVVHTALFPGLAEVLSLIKKKSLAFGIITNKHSRFSVPIMAQMQLNEAVLICGDTAAYAKPHPAPLLLAAERLGIAASRCVYVGDAGTDMLSAKSAGMIAVAAAWGFIPPWDSVAAWPYDVLCETPSDLLRLLASASA